MRYERPLLGLVLASLSMTTAAHHSPAAHFDLSKRVTIAGTVTEFRFENPHALIFFEVAREDGSVEPWVAEGGNTGALRHLGWTGSELRLGDEVTVVGNPSRDGSRTINWQTIAIAGGPQLAGGNGSFIFPALEKRWRRHRETEQ
jgi:Family of unknown function (DUF6152)